MPASAPFPFWRVTGLAPGQLDIAAGFLASTLPQGRSFYLFSQDGLSGANSSFGGEFRTQAGFGGNTTGNAHESYGGYLYSYAGWGGDTTGIGSPSRGGPIYHTSGYGGVTAGANSGSYGGNFTLRAGVGGDAPGVGSYSRGGYLRVYGGDGGDSDYATYGGSILMYAGNGGLSVSSGSYGGSIILRAGDGTDYGGTLIFSSGNGVVEGDIQLNSSGYITLNSTAPGFVQSLGLVKIASTIVANLPAASAANRGARWTVTDSNAVSFTTGIGAVVAAGGATVVPVFSDGTNWRIG